MTWLDAFFFFVKSNCNRFISLLLYNFNVMHHITWTQWELLEDLNNMTGDVTPIIWWNTEKITYINQKLFRSADGFEWIKFIFFILLTEERILEKNLICMKINKNKNKKSLSAQTLLRIMRFCLNWNLKSLRWNENFFSFEWESKL